MVGIADAQIRAMYQRDEEGEISTRGGWNCLSCGHNSRTQQDMYRHVEAKHVSTGGFNCPFCGHYCPSLNSLRNHKHRHHRNGQWLTGKNIHMQENFPFQHYGRRWWVNWRSSEMDTTSALCAITPPTGKTTRPGTYWPSTLAKMNFMLRSRHSSVLSASPVWRYRSKNKEILLDWSNGQCSTIEWTQFGGKGWVTVDEL